MRRILFISSAAVALAAFQAPPPMPDPAGPKPLKPPPMSPVPTPSASPTLSPAPMPAPTMSPYPRRSRTPQVTPSPLPSPSPSGAPAPNYRSAEARDTGDSGMVQRDDQPPKSSASGRSRHHLRT